MGTGGVTLTWFVIRGSGIVAYLLLSGATVWGLLVSTKVLGRAVKAKGVTWFHESVGLAAVLATIVHMVALTLDEFVHFGAAELLVPGASTWEPLPVAYGVAAFYGAFVVAFSFYVKRWIGQGAWRTIHFLSFGTFVSATVHGITAGTDSGSRYAFAMYLGSSLAVALLLVVRIAQTHAPPAPARPVPSTGSPAQEAVGMATVTSAPPSR